MSSRPEESGPPIDAGCDDDRWPLLHQELDRLPQFFRAPLVLLHLEGLTQEQAAAQLRLPLGTLQSRSARGRARLKARLEKRGAALSAGLLEAGSIASLRTAPPPVWTDATVKLALQFSAGKAGAVASAGAAAAELAREILRAGLLARLKVAIVLLLSMAAVVTSAAAWTWRPEQPQLLIAAKNVEIPAERVPPEVAAAPPQAIPEPIKRTVRGIVRDEQGRPVAKAWVGFEIKPLPDAWKLLQPPSHIRETKVPYRDATGKIVAAGALGKYFELRDDAANWKPIHPAQGSPDRIPRDPRCVDHLAGSLPRSHRLDPKRGRRRHAPVPHAARPSAGR